MVPRDVHVAGKTGKDKIERNVAVFKKTIPLKMRGRTEVHVSVCRKAQTDMPALCLGVCCSALYRITLRSMLSKTDLSQINVVWVDCGPQCFSIVRDTHLGQDKLRNHPDTGQKIAIESLKTEGLNWGIWKRLPQKLCIVVSPSSLWKTLQQAIVWLACRPHSNSSTPKLRV